MGVRRQAYQLRKASVKNPLHQSCTRLPRYGANGEELTGEPARAIAVRAPPARHSATYPVWSDEPDSDLVAVVVVYRQCHSGVPPLPTAHETLLSYELGPGVAEPTP